MTTLRRERIQKFSKIIKEFLVGFDELPIAGMKAEIDELAALLADAAESKGERKTDETAEEYNVHLFRGDFHDFPEHLWGVAETLRDVWMFRLPAKPKKKTGKGEYAMWCAMMENVKDACGEFGTDVLIKVHADWKTGFKGGIAPYTVAKPSSLVNPCSGKARELRDGGSKSDERTSMLRTL
jgi:hypothetical protein